MELREATRDLLTEPAEAGSDGARRGKRRHGRPEQADGHGPATTRGGAIRTAGRLALWAVVLLILVRGAGAVLAGGSQDAVPATKAATGSSWPGDEARAFAADFARAYLTYSPEHPEYHALALRPFLASD